MAWLTSLYSNLPRVCLLFFLSRLSLVTENEEAVRDSGLFLLPSGRHSTSSSVDRSSSLVLSARVSTPQSTKFTVDILLPTVVFTIFTCRCRSFSKSKWSVDLWSWTLTSTSGKTRSWSLPMSSSWAWFEPLGSRMKWIWLWTYLSGQF